MGGGGIKGQPADLHEQIRGGVVGKETGKAGAGGAVTPQQRCDKEGGEAGSGSAAAGVRRNARYADGVGLES